MHNGFRNGMPSRPPKGMEQVGLTGFSKIPTVSLSHANYLTLTLCTISCNTTDSILMLSASGKFSARRDAKAKRLKRDAKAGHLKTQCGAVKGECPPPLNWARTSKVLVLLFLDAIRANPGFSAAIQGPSGLGDLRNMVVVRFVSFRSVA